MTASCPGCGGLYPPYTLAAGRGVALPALPPACMSRLPAILFALAVLLTAAHCTLEEDFLTEPGTRIGLSADTLSFDTVFTAVGSATRSFKIYNPHQRPLSLASVRVESDNGGRFRINVDGVSGTEVEDVFVPAEDSIYVFAEVTVDPDAPVSVSPFILEGRVVVTATTEEQSVLLVAYGQNAVYLPESRARGRLGLITCELGEVIFADERPYVLYGSLLVDSCTMVLPAGTRLYVHGGLVQDTLAEDRPIFNDGRILFFDRGRLRVEGTADEPVLIATDRLEERFVTRAGQWSGIYLLAGTGPHNINYADIRNADFGLLVDSAAVLDVANTRLRYTAREGIRARAAEVDARNVLIHSTGGAAFAGIQGGDYRLDHCTVVNYAGRNPAIALANGLEVAEDDIRVGPLDARVRNSILYGANADAIGLIDFERDAPLDYAFSNIVTRVDRLGDAYPNFRDDCLDCLYPAPEDPLFLNPQRDSFQLDSLSVAEKQAAPLPDVPVDIDGADRDADAPDIGAYERPDE